jgi:hypothetical protein
MPRGHEFCFWSPILGCDAARISMVIPPSTPGRPRDPREGAEYFTIIAADVPGGVCRERRRKAREAIEDAIARGLDPGEVRCSDQS